MSDTRSDSALSHAAKLERRDDELAAAVGAITGISERVDRLRARALEIAAFLEGLPAERAHLEQAHVDARRQIADARDAAAAADAALEKLREGRGAKQDAISAAERDVENARADVAAADAHLARLGERRAQLVREEAAVKTESSTLAADASNIARELRAMPRLSRQVGEAPGRGLEQLAEWGAAAHAALLVVRAGLETERERIVREANELAASALGEPLAATSVAAVRERLENAEL